MDNNISRRIVRIKPKVRIWSAVEGSLEEVVPYKQFFFEWKGGCLLGTYYKLQADQEDQFLSQKRC
jgi:hypothetical protein